MTGGAEVMLYRLLSVLDRDRFEPHVISITGDGPLGDALRKAGVPVRLLEMDARAPNPVLLFKLMRWLREIRPALVQTWMYHADLIGGVAAYLTRRPVLWGIHTSSLDASAVKPGSRKVVRVNAALSRWLPQGIVSCSERARISHVAFGFRSDKFVVIPNGFDLEVFRPDASARASVLRELKLGTEAHLIGLVARFDPVKDHETFIRAAGILHRRDPKAHFVLCGKGISWENSGLCSWIDAEDLSAHCSLLGRRDDVPRLMAALDLCTLSSIAEAFPNVLGEAMACGVPCVSTDVGDAADVIGATGIVVPPRDPEALANGWARVLSLAESERAGLAREARKRIESRYSIRAIARQYEAVFSRFAS